MRDRLYFVAKKTGELYGLRKPCADAPAEWLDGDDGVPIKMSEAVARYLFGSHFDEYVLVEARDAAAR